MPYCAGSKASSVRSPSLACFSDSEMRRRSRSMSMTLTSNSSPTLTTCSGISTWRSASSEMWTRPSMPSWTRTKAPNGTSLVTLPGTTWPIWCVRAKCRHGSSCVALSDVETLDGDLLAALDDLGRVVDVLPGQLGHVHQPVDAAEVDERAEVDDAR